MDGPAEVNQVRAPKRPYPEKEEEMQDVRCFASPTHLLLNHQTYVGKKKCVKKPHKVQAIFPPIFSCTTLIVQLLSIVSWQTNA